MAEINTMPYNRDAEMALLGCLLIDNDIAADLVEKLTEDDFYQESHKFIIHAMQKVFAGRQPIDLVTLSDELDGEGNLEKAGGIAYLTELAQITPSAANYKSYYDIVNRDSTNRRLIRASRKIIENCMTGAERQGRYLFCGKIGVRHFQTGGPLLSGGNAGGGHRAAGAAKIRVHSIRPHCFPRHRNGLLNVWIR